MGRVFQTLNIVPRRVITEFASNDLLHIEVDVCGLMAEKLAPIAGKLRQAPCVVNARAAKGITALSVLDRVGGGAILSAESYR